MEEVMVDEAKEFMSLDDIIKMKQVYGGNSVSNSVVRSVAGTSTASHSRRGGFRARGGFQMGPMMRPQNRGGYRARGGFQMGPMTRPRNIDWNWTKESGSSEKIMPVGLKFFRGGRGMMRGNFWFRRPQQQRNPNFFGSPRGRGGTRFFHQTSSLLPTPSHSHYLAYQSSPRGRFLGNGRWMQKRTLEQQLLPVHQRLGWTSLAQNVARNRVKVASWFLNKRNQYPTGQYHYQHNNYSNYTHNMRERGLLRHQRHLTALNSAASEISVSVFNERANQRQMFQPRLPQRAGRGNMVGVSRLSKQNVALLPNEGMFAHPHNSNRSMARSYYSQNMYAQSQRRPRRKRSLFSMPHLSIAPGHSASLSSIGLQLGNVPAASHPARKHVVVLDQKLQSEITEIQRVAAANNGDSNSISIAASLNYRPAPFATTTSISDRFSILPAA